MTRDRWKRVERALDAVLDSEPHEWDAMIAEHCGADAELRAEVESLVARHGLAQRFLEVPALAAMATAGWGRLAGGAPSGESGEVSRPAEESLCTDPLLGSSVGHYRIEGRLGGGGMGVVYRARDTRLERDVALKFLPPHLGLDPKAKSRFLVEARAAAALDHPNICTVHEIGEAGDGRLFIAMACYRGEVLKERIARGPLPVQKALAITAGIARGLSAAHARGIVHRDVKPANVMLTTDGGVKLLDFGVAKLADVTLTRSGVTPGTVAYMSPEQIRREDVDARSDLWSLGIVLYEMLSGGRPFLGEHDAAVMHAILHDAPRPLTELLPEISAGLPDVVDRLLARDQVKRYPSARCLLADLESVGAADRNVGVMRRRKLLLTYARQALSRKGILALSALLLLALAGLISASLFAARPAEIRRVALLPLANLTGDPGLDYFVEGVHYALSSELARIEGLTVYSRQSVLRYGRSDLPLPEIARELGVDALLEGAVFKSGDSVRITVQFLRARPEQHMLAATHTGLLSQALVLHNVVAREIADSVHARLAPAQARERRAAQRAVDPAAEKAFLEGLYHLEGSLKVQFMSGQEQVEVLENAIQHFKKAIELDPEWAAPHARLSTAYKVLSDNLPEDAAAEYVNRAKAAALRGIELDAADAEAHASLASVLLFNEQDWAGAGRAIRRSLELDPQARAWTAAAFMMGAGRHDEAIPLLRKAERRYPLSERLRLGAVMAYACADRSEEAIAQARELTDRVTRSGRTGVAGDSTWLLNFLAYENSIRGEHAEAIAAAEALVARQADTESRIALAFVYARAGRRDEARILARRLESEARSRGVPWGPAQLYAALGETNRALDIVDAAAEERRPEWNFRCSVTYRLLAHEPRMRELVRSFGFPSSD